MAGLLRIDRGNGISQKGPYAAKMCSARGLLPTSRQYCSSVLRNTRGNRRWLWVPASGWQGVFGPRMCAAMLLELPGDWAPQVVGASTVL